MSGYRALVGELADLVRLAHSALGGATAVLTDPAAGHDAIAAAEKDLAELRARIEEDSATALDGRPGVVVGVHVGCEVEALGQLVQRLLEAAWARQEREPYGDRLLAPLRGLAGAALDLVAQAADALESGAPEGVTRVLTELPDTGRRQRLLYELLLRDGATDQVDAADLVLLACCYQQCADHAGAIARHAALFAHAGA
ncbi:hypothetical protein [Kitasatospora aureofaciens]|uniref:hypothetical protein n=1 Tax=Kitasatospora aureofaciens TaxID=1894 RepID=UPI000526F7BB|nr:hypothetical protein [Kitasatospora aureofaciens]